MATPPKTMAGTQITMAGMYTLLTTMAGIPTTMAGHAANNGGHADNNGGAGGGEARVCGRLLRHGAHRPVRATLSACALDPRP
eukprot:609337-Rhodomonas_salina.4